MASANVSIASESHDRFISRYKSFVAANELKYEEEWITILPTTFFEKLKESIKPPRYQSWRGLKVIDPMGTYEDGYLALQISERKEDKNFDVLLWRCGNTTAEWESYWVKLLDFLRESAGVRVLE